MSVMLQKAECSIQGQEEKQGGIDLPLFPGGGAGASLAMEGGQVMQKGESAWICCVLVRFPLP